MIDLNAGMKQGSLGLRFQELFTPKSYHASSIEDFLASRTEIQTTGFWKTRFCNFAYRYGYKDTAVILFSNVQYTNLGLCVRLSDGVQTLEPDILNPIMLQTQEEKDGIVPGDRVALVGLLYHPNWQDLDIFAVRKFHDHTAGNSSLDYCFAFQGAF